MANVGTVRIDTSDILQDIYNSEINVTISWFWDGGFNAVVGDDHNGIRKVANHDTWGGTVSWLATTVCALYPDSDFARKWGDDGGG